MSSINTHVQQSKSNKLKLAIAGIALTATVAIGGSIAYLTDSATIQNELSLDTNLKVQLVEPSFDAEAAKNLVPLQVVAKDPTIVNSGTVDEYVAATVKVPVFSGSMLNNEGKIVEVKDHDLFSYTLGQGWTQLGSAALADGFRTYTYVYQDALTAEAQAAPVFESLTVANLTKDAGITETTVDVCGYAIQSYGFDDATQAYQAYLNQHAAGTSTDD